MDIRRYFVPKPNVFPLSTTRALVPANNPSRLSCSNSLLCDAIDGGDPESHEETKRTPQQLSLEHANEPMKKRIKETISSYSLETPNQPNVSVIPKQKLKNRELSFQATWYEKFPWIHYEVRICCRNN